MYDGLYDEIVVKRVRAAGLPFEHFDVDHAARPLLRFPKATDAVLCMNLYGDILSDLGVERRAASGWPRPATSATAGPDRSVHGSAPDIAGKAIANPTATILSAALMLEHMGMIAEAQRLEAAVGRIDRDGKVLTPDQGGTARTRELAQAVLAAYR